MKSHAWEQQIIRAAAEGGDVLAAMPEHLASCELAKTILRFKGYGQTGDQINVMVREVPNALGQE